MLKYLRVASVVTLVASHNYSFGCASCSSGITSSPLVLKSSEKAAVLVSQDMSIDHALVKVGPHNKSSFVDPEIKYKFTTTLAGAYRIIPKLFVTATVPIAVNHSKKHTNFTIDADDMTVTKVTVDPKTKYSLADPSLSVYFLAIEGLKGNHWIPELLVSGSFKAAVSQSGLGAKMRDSVDVFSDGFHSPSLALDSSWDLGHVRLGFSETISFYMPKKVDSYKYTRGMQSLSLISVASPIYATLEMSAGAAYGFSDVIKVTTPSGNKFSTGVTKTPYVFLGLNFGLSHFQSIGFTFTSVAPKMLKALSYNTNAYQEFTLSYRHTL